MRRARGRDLGAPLLLLGLLAGEGAAQQGCEFLAGTGDYVVQFGVTYIQTPRLSCRDGLRIVADSAVHFESAAFYQLFGRVNFENSEIRLRSGAAQYYEQAGRITAQEDVDLLRKADSTLVTGENLEYLQINQFRTQEQLTVTGGRPHAVLHPRTQGAEPPDTARLPYEVDADRIFVLGDQQFQANGSVEITRGELDASARDVDYNGTSGQLVLNGDARLVTETYDLAGEMVLLEMPGEEIREVIARERGVLDGEDLELRAPLIHLFLTAGVLDRLVATRLPDGSPVRAEPAEPVAPVVGIRGALEARETETAPEEHPSRPVAVAEGFTITADSLDVLVPAEVLETIHAIGTARAVSSARDSLNQEDTPEIARRDWIAGDTVIATLVPVADSLAADEQGREYTLERLVARLNASSLYRMPPTDSARAEAEAEGTTPDPRRMAVHYVKGDSITIVLEGGEVASMEVAGQTSGVHLEPRAEGDRTAPEGSAPDPGSTEPAAPPGSGPGGVEGRPPGAPPPQPAGARPPGGSPDGESPVP